MRPGMPLLCTAQLAFILTSVLMGSFAVLTSYANRSPLVRNRASRLRVVEKGGLDTGQQTRAGGERRKMHLEGSRHSKGKGTGAGQPVARQQRWFMHKHRWAHDSRCNMEWARGEWANSETRNHPPVRLYSTPLLTRTNALCPTAL